MHGMYDIGWVGGERRHQGGNRGGEGERREGGRGRGGKEEGEGGRGRGGERQETVVGRRERVIIRVLVGC